MLPHPSSVSEGWNAVGGEETTEEVVAVGKAEVVEAGGQVVDRGEIGGASLVSVSSFVDRCGGSGWLW